MNTKSPIKPETEHADWEDYADLLANAHIAHQPEIRELIQQLPLAGVQRVLDAPCGDGFYTELIAEVMDAGGDIVGVDRDIEALFSLEHHQDSFKGQINISSVQADNYKLPLPGESFDFVWCAQSLISLSEPSETLPGQGILTALEEFRRVLRPGGRIAVLEQDAMHYVLLPWPAELELALHQAERKGFGKKYGRPEQLDMGRHLGRLLAEGGFQVERRLSLTADRQAPLNPPELAFLKSYFKELRSRVVEHLSRDDCEMFDRLTNPNSPDSFLHDPQFQMTWLEFVCLAQKN